jgi:hypothetical protein
MRPEWQVAADARAACVGRRVMLRIRNSAASGPECQVASFDHETRRVALPSAGRETDADGGGVVCVSVADVVPALYNDLAQELHKCALKVVCIPGSFMVYAPVLNEVMDAVDSCVMFHICCARDAKRRVCLCPC